MTASEIINYIPISKTNPETVAKIKASIMAEGWKGAPILVSELHGRLITGSHRLAALKDIYNNEWNFDLEGLGEIAEDVDDILEEWCRENNCTIDEVPYDRLRTIFAETRVEKYKDYIEEW